jgi:uncharacterized membrane protein
VTRQDARTALTVAVSVSFAIAAHVAILDGLPAQAGALLAIVPLAVLLLFLSRRIPRQRAPLFALLVGLIAIASVFPFLKAHFTSVFFLEHAGAQLVLALVFGRTLMAGHEPLVSRFARIVHGRPLSPEETRYTRGVTAAWTIFFCALFALACTLYLGGFTAAWSTLANILTPVFVGAMFVVEYAVRCRVLPHIEHVGLLGGIQAFSRHFGAAQPQSPR